MHPNVLIVDEPTRGIDVGSKSEIHNLIRDLAAQGYAIIVISSEMPEVLHVSDRIVAMYRGGHGRQSHSGDLRHPDRSCCIRQTGKTKSGREVRYGRGSRQFAGLQGTARNVYAGRTRPCTVNRLENL